MREDGMLLIEQSIGQGPGGEALTTMDPHD